MSHNKPGVINVKYESLQNPEIKFISCEESSYNNYNNTKSKELILIFKLLSNYNFEKITIFSNPFFLYAYKEIIKVRIPLIQTELKRFFSNYKDYFYLPKEDMAVLKSVASSVDIEYRENAKKETCYIKYRGFFIPNINPEDSGLKTDYKSKITYKEFKSANFSETEAKEYVTKLIEYLNR